MISKQYSGSILARDVPVLPPSHGALCPGASQGKPSSRAILSASSFSPRPRHARATRRSDSSREPGAWGLECSKRIPSVGSGRSATKTRSPSRCRTDPPSASISALAEDRSAVNRSASCFTRPTRPRSRRRVLRRREAFSRVDVVTGIDPPEQTGLSDADLVEGTRDLNPRVAHAHVNVVLGVDSPHRAVARGRHVLEFARHLLPRIPGTTVDVVARVDAPEL